MKTRLMNILCRIKATMMPAPSIADLSFDIPAKELRTMVEFRQLGNMKHRSSAVVMTRMLLSILVAVICWNAVPAWLMLLWLAFNVMHTLACLKSTDDFFNSPSAYHDFRFWRNRTMQMTLVSGLAWGFAGFFFMHSDAPIDHVVLMGIIVGTAFGSVPLYACWLPGLWSFLPAILLPPYLRIVELYDVPAVTTIELLITIVFVLIYFGRRLNQIFTESIYQAIEREQLMVQLIQQRQKAEFAHAAAEMAIVNRTRFFAGANHDLRQPLQAMSIFISLLESTVDAKSKPLVENLSKACQSVSTLVDQILMISKLEAGSLKSNPSTFNIRTLIEELESEFTPMAEKKGLTVEMRAEDLMIYSDEFLLSRILRNLIGNSLRYTREGKIVVRAKKYRSDKMIISVCDQGSGISAEDRAHLFSEFFRGDAGRSAGEGFGLGLSIVHKIADLLGIRLKVRSKVGTGTIFRLEMSLAPETKQVEMLQTVPRGDTIQSLSGVSVLLIEDDHLVRQSIEALLVAWGAKVVAKEKYDAEVSVPFINGQSLDLILSDFNLGPGQPTGLQAILRIRSALGRRIPAVITTAVSRDIVVEQYEEETEGYNFSEQGADLMSLPVIIQKPVTPQQLNRAIFRLTTPNRDSH